MVAHLCCSVDAGYFLKRLKEEFPDEKIIGFFYDPNIHPYSEFKLRSLDTERICKKLGVEFVEGEYDYENWLKTVNGLENEPEKGVRCSVCFDFSLEATAEFALKRGDNKITTSLLMSPMKSKEQLNRVAKAIKRKYGIDFYSPDYRIKGGTQEQQKYAKENRLYRQNYCGCIYGLWKQKQIQPVIGEMLSPVTQQVLPASIEEKLQIYKKRIEYEKKGVKYKIIKETFLNYRLLRAFVKSKNRQKKWQTIESYILFYSFLNRSARGKIDFIENEIGYFNRMQILFVKIDKVNTVLNKKYKNVKEMLLFPPTIEEEIFFREKITKTKYSLTPVIILDNIDEMYEVYIDAKTYPDVREILIKF